MVRSHAPADGTHPSLEELTRVRLLTTSGAARLIRQAARASLVEVGRASGNAASTIWRWEQKERVPHGAGAVRYLRVLEEMTGGG